MNFLRKNIVIVWWLTSFAAANAAWFFIARVNFVGIIQRALQPYLDGIFFTGAGLTVLAALIAFWAMTNRTEKRRKLLTKIWFIYLGLYAVFAVCVMLFFASLTVTVS